MPSDFGGGGGAGGALPVGNTAAAPKATSGGLASSLIPLGLLAATAFGSNNQTVPGSGPVTQAALQNAQTQGMLTGQAGQNISYVNTGALPAGAQATIDNAANADRAKVRSAFASMGIPPGSTAEAQELGAVDANAASQAFEMQQKLLQSGIAEANVGGSYGTLVNQEDLALMNAQIQQNNQLNAAIANFAKALA
jgi:hypothetical protein